MTGSISLGNMGGAFSLMQQGIDSAVSGLDWDGLSTGQQIMLVGGGVAAAGVALALLPEIAVGTVISETGAVIATAGLSSQALGAATALSGLATMAGGALNELADKFGPAISHMMGGGPGDGLQPVDSSEEFNDQYTEVEVPTSDGDYEVVVVELPEGGPES